MYYIIGILNILNRFLTKYKVPRLRKGALPQVFPNCPKYLSKSLVKKRKSPKKTNNLLEKPRDEKSDKDNNFEADSINTAGCIEGTENGKETEGKGTQTKANERFTNGIPDVPAFMDSEHLQNITFETIFNDEKSIQFPISWARHSINFGDYKMIQFSQCTGKLVNGIIEPVSAKQVVIKENMEVWIAIFGKPINVKKMGIEKNVTTKNSIEEVIEAVDKFALCRGCANPGVIESFQNSRTHRDKEGFLRHNNCAYILCADVASKGICKDCHRAAETISRKRRKLNVNESLITAKRIRLSNLNEQNTKKVQLLREQIRRSKNNQKRVSARITIFKKVLEKCQARMSQMCSLSVQKLLDKENITGNERLAINEILKASKNKSVKSRKYSDEWIMLCLLLHMKSPTTYNFLRDNNFLVLPCTRTIRK